MIGQGRGSADAGLLSSRLGEEGRSSLRFVSMRRPFALPVISVFAAGVVLTGCAGGNPAPRATGSPALAKQAAAPATSPPDAPAVACSKFETAIAGPLGAALNRAPGAFGLHGTLDRYGGDFGGWSHAIPLNSKNLRLINNLEDAGIWLVIAGTVPVRSLRAQDLKRAFSDVDKVTSDCNAVQ